MANQVVKCPTPDFGESLTPALLGQAVKAKRTQSHLRLEDAALLCGVAKETLMRIEHGQDTSQLGTVLKVCHSLGIELFVKPWHEEGAQNNDWY